MMSYEEVKRRLDSMRWNLESDLRNDNFRDDPFIKMDLEKNIEALEIVISIMTPNT